MEIKIHEELFRRDDHWATVIPHRVISFLVDGRRLFFKHIIAVDRRGSHYGDTCEHLELIKNPNQYRQLRQMFVRRGTIDDHTVDALKVSTTKCLYRGGSFGISSRTPWSELREGRVHRLEYSGFSNSFPRKKSLHGRRTKNKPR